MRYFKIVDPDELEDMSDIIPISWHKIDDDFYSCIPDWFTVNRKTINPDNKEVDEVSVLYTREVSEDYYKDTELIIDEDIKDDFCYFLEDDF